MDPLPSSIGRYQVRERLGQGGMGVLYLALDPSIDRLVALKLLRVDDAELRERFQREARLVARLQSPGIVTIYEIATHNGQPYMAMEYIAGDTLEAIIRRRTPMPVTRKLALMAELCDALAAAHRAGIVHRDIKPSNVIVQRESGLLKVLDFGIARTIDSSLTQVGAILGTPNYISPEQVEGRPVDHRSDMFAVGVTSYELLTYRQAFTGETPFLVLQRIVHDTPEPLLDLDPTLDPGLQAIVDRAIAKDPDARYTDLDAMRADILHVLRRSEAGSQERTLVIGPPASLPLPGAAGGSQGAPPAGGVRGRTSGTDLARFLEQRAAQINERLRAADAALDRGDPEQALIDAEQAAVIDPHEPRTMATLERVRAAVDRARELARLVGRARQHAEASLDEGDLAGARRAAAEAMGYDPQSAEARQLRQRVEAAIEARARETIERAENDEWTGALSAALARLEAFRPSHDLVERAAARLRETLAEQQRAADAEARLTAAVAERLSTARAALARGDVDAAEAAVAEARQLDDTHAEAAALDREIARALAARQREERRLARAAQKQAAQRRTIEPGTADRPASVREPRPGDRSSGGSLPTAAVEMRSDRRESDDVPPDSAQAHFAQTDSAGHAAGALGGASRDGVPGDAGEGRVENAARSFGARAEPFGARVEPFGMHPESLGMRAEPPVAEETGASGRERAGAAARGGARAQPAHAQGAQSAQQRRESSVVDSIGASFSSDVAGWQDDETPWWQARNVSIAAAALLSAVLLTVLVLQWTEPPVDARQNDGAELAAARNRAGDASSPRSPGSAPGASGTATSPATSAPTTTSAPTAGAPSAGTPPAGAPTTSAVTEAAVIESTVAGITDRVRSLLEGRQDTAVLEEMSKAQAAYGTHPRIKALMIETVRAAEEDAARARRRALRAQAPARATGDFARADEAMAVAGKGRDAGQALDAARAYWRAARLFGEAGEHASLAPPESGRAPTPDETTAIQNALNRWANAYGTLDAKKVSDAWPAMSRDQSRALEEAFKGMTRYLVTFQGCQIVLPGERAAASCLLRRAIDYKAAAPQRFDSRVLFQLERRGDKWAIVGVRPS